MKTPPNCTQKDRPVGLLCLPVRSSTPSRANRRRHRPATPPSVVTSHPPREALVGTRSTASHASPPNGRARVWGHQKGQEPYARALEQLAASPDPRRLLTSARREAEALAWTTPFPALFLPALLQEKLEEALARAAKQAQVRQQSSRLWIESRGVSTDPLPEPEPAVDGDFTL